MKTHDNTRKKHIMQYKGIDFFSCFLLLTFSILILPLELYKSRGFRSSTTKRISGISKRIMQVSTNRSMCNKNSRYYYFSIHRVYIMFLYTCFGISFFFFSCTYSQFITVFFLIIVKVYHLPMRCICCVLLWDRW